MTCAPRGMERTKSARSGRNARYPVLAVEKTTDPSGAPMRSSWAIAPRWVWNCLPGSRTTVCSRPLGSVSCTRSPTTNPPATGSRARPSSSGAASVRGSCCVSTGGQRTGGPTTSRRALSELSVGGPSLGRMTAMAQDSAHDSRVQTGQPDAAAASPDAPAEEPAAPRRPSLSPSRAADFKTCPLLYRFRTIDRLPERKSRAAVRGTLVHAVLERLYDLPQAQRMTDAAHELMSPAWADLQAADPEVAGLFAQGADEEVPQESLEAWLTSAGRLVESYFALEDPTRIQPQGREQLVEVTLPDGLLLRGYVDRLDVAPNGALRVVDYKTGSMPREAFEAKALFQMKFYALVLWRTRGVVAAQLKLLYLKDGDALTYAPDEAELLRFERTLQAIWAAIERAVATGDFRANKSRLCSWCDHQALCPAFGGTPPPFPTDAAAAAGWRPPLPVPPVCPAWPPAPEASSERARARVRGGRRAG